MACYFQMGHDTENLVGEVDLSAYKGIILSPVNRTPTELKKHIATFKENGAYDIVLDPQLYLPRCKRAKLKQHPYFSIDIDTTDLGNVGWWEAKTKILAEYASDLKVTSITTPTHIPLICDSSFYLNCSAISGALATKLAGSGIQVLTTVLINTADLSTMNKPFEVASILSAKPSDGYYIVFVSDVAPRREISNEGILLGMLILIRELRASGRPVLVSHCSSDMILFKYAEADHCATGKFFNLRRFTKSRYDETSPGGGQLSYWFEHSLLAFIRQADLLRLRRNGYSSMIGASYSGNSWGNKILEYLKEPEPDPWLALGWRQYLSWFVKAEAELSSDREQTTAWLKKAEENWITLETAEVFFEERTNNGSWLRSWRQALSSFKKNQNSVKTFLP